MPPQSSINTRRVKTHNCHMRGASVAPLRCTTLDFRVKTEKTWNNCVTFWIVDCFWRLDSSFCSRLTSEWKSAVEYTEAIFSFWLLSCRKSEPFTKKHTRSSYLHTPKNPQNWNPSKHAMKRDKEGNHTRKHWQRLFTHAQVLYCIKAQE